MEMEEEQIFGIPEEGETRIEASVSHDTDRYDEKQESMGQSKPEKPRRSMKSGTKAKAKAKEKAKNKLTPLLNALGIEITETMDLLCLAASPDPRISSQAISCDDWCQIGKDILLAHDGRYIWRSANGAVDWSKVYDCGENVYPAIAGYYSRMTVLCRKVGATLLKMEDIRCQITAEMER